MTILHLRLRGETVTALKRRAGLAGVAPMDYIGLVLWYAALEWGDPAIAGDPSLASMDDEELYLSALLPGPLRERMISRSAAQSSNLASYTGALVEKFFQQYERDPGDLRLVARLSELLDRRAIPIEEEFLEVLRLVAGSPVARMPEVYQARWLHQRLSPFLRQIQVEGGATVELTVERIRSLLDQLKTGSD